MQNPTLPQSPADLFFRRRFSFNPCNTLRLPLGEMSLARDWLHTDGRGDPYPELVRGGDVREEISGGSYRAAGKGCIARLIGRFFPYATYELTVDSLDEGCAAGFSFRTQDKEVRLLLTRCGESFALRREGDAAELLASDIPAEPGLRLQITWQVRTAFITLIGRERRQLPPLHIPAFADMDCEDIFSAATAALLAAPCGGTLSVRGVTFCLDGGVCHADPRPIRYEDGTPLMENGRLFITWSTRSGSGGFQSVVSWTPGLCDFRMEGAIFFDYGDGRWRNDVATSLIYDRRQKKWLLWACAFHGGHYLMHAEFDGDPRFGLQLIDAECMPTQSGIPGDGRLSDDTLWLGKAGDEDPDLLYDEAEGRWYMSVCRVSRVEGRDTYRYFIFSSEEPFASYRFEAMVEDVGVTGGSLLFFGGKKHLVYGRRFDARAEYACVCLEDPAHPRRLSCDYDDGGFRGWGTIIPVPCGRRTRWVWLTFDRDLGCKEDNWSYGNLYVYDA